MKRKTKSCVIEAIIKKKVFDGTKEKKIGIKFFIRIRGRINYKNF